MKVALVTPGFPPDVGGVELYVHKLAIGLGRLGCEVDVITQCPPGGARRLLNEPAPGAGVRVLRFDDWTHTRQFRVAPSLWTYLRANRSTYDVIHAHNFHAIPALFAATQTVSPLVFTPYYHGGGHSRASAALHVPYRRMTHRIFSRSSAVLCISDAERERVVRDYPEVAERAFTLGIGVDADAIRQAEPFAPGRQVVLSLGRLEAYKQVTRAIESFARVDLPAEMVIIGKGPEEERIAGVIRELDLGDRVRMVGRLGDEEVRRWQRTASAVVSLSRVESFGLGLAESAVAGARIVASDIPAHREVSEMSGQKFTFVDPDADTGDIADAITDALSAPMGEDRSWAIPTWEDVARWTIVHYYWALENGPVTLP